MNDFKHLTMFKPYCQKVLPLVYDESLSYYEVLCKVLKYIDDMIDNDEIQQNDIESLQADMLIVKQWIQTFDSFSNEQIEKIIAEYLKIAVFFQLTDAGYFVAYVPQTWDDIQFGTSGYDENVNNVDYGHLTLSY